MTTLELPNFILESIGVRQWKAQLAAFKGNIAKLIRVTDQRFGKFNNVRINRLMSDDRPGIANFIGLDKCTVY